MKQRERWRGLSALLGDAVAHGTTAVERIHMETARRPFEIIESIAPIAAPTKLVHELHDAIVTNTYRQIRFWNAAVQKVVQIALADDAPSEAAPEAPRHSADPRDP